MRVTGNGKLVELEETEVDAFEADECWLRFAEPNPSNGGYAVYAWCMKGDPVFPGQNRIAKPMRTLG
jgi:hypothetical protein